MCSVFSEQIITSHCHLQHDPVASPAPRPQTQMWHARRNQAWQLHQLKDCSSPWFKLSLKQCFVKRGCKLNDQFYNAYFILFPMFCIFKHFAMFCQTFFWSNEYFNSLCAVLFGALWHQLKRVKIGPMAEGQWFSWQLKARCSAASGLLAWLRSPLIVVFPVTHLETSRDRLKFSVWCQNWWTKTVCF